jgi:hypothetical protein
MKEEIVNLSIEQTVNLRFPYIGMKALIYKMKI